MNKEVVLFKSMEEKTVFFHNAFNTLTKEFILAGNAVDEVKIAFYDLLERTFSPEISKINCGVFNQ